MKRNISRMARAIGVASLVVAPVAMVAPAVPAAATAATDARLNRAVGALRAINTMQADFTQVGRGGQRASGVMTLKRPGKIRFQYEKGIPLLIVSDGHRLTMIDYEVRQKQVWPVGNSPLGALLDPGRDVSRFGKLLPTEHPDVTSIRVKDPKHPEYGSITLIFQDDASAPGGMTLASWVTVDSQNKVTKVFLYNHRYGLSVSENTFRYRDVETRKKR